MHVQLVRFARWVVSPKKAARPTLSAADSVWSGSKLAQDAGADRRTGVHERVVATASISVISEPVLLVYQKREASAGERCGVFIKTQTPAPLRVLCTPNARARGP